MRSTSEIGLKITAANREFFRYTSDSAQLERGAAGSSRPDLAWTNRIKEQEEEQPLPAPSIDPATKSSGCPWSRFWDQGKQGPKIRLHPVTVLPRKNALQEDNTG